jgi:hypothetical protein
VKRASSRRYGAVAKVKPGKSAATQIGMFGAILPLLASTARA